MRHFRLYLCLALPGLPRPASRFFLVAMLRLPSTEFASAVSRPLKFIYVVPLRTSFAPFCISLLWRAFHLLRKLDLWPSARSVARAAADHSPRRLND